MSFRENLNNIKNELKGEISIDSLINEKLNKSLDLYKEQVEKSIYYLNHRKSEKVLEKLDKKYNVGDGD